MLNRKISKEIGKQNINNIDLKKYQFKTKRNLLEADLNNNFLNKVKVIDDGYFTKKSKGTHYALVTGYLIDPQNLTKQETDILINAITSLTDKKGNIDPNKARKVFTGLLVEIPPNYTTSKRRGALKIETNDFNISKHRKIKVKDLKDPNFNYEIDKGFINNFKNMVFDENSKNPIIIGNVKKGKKYKK